MIGSMARRLSAGAGTKGGRLRDRVYLELADLDGGEYNEALAGQAWARGLLIRRKISDGDLAFFRKVGENRRTSLGDRRRFRNDEE